MGTDCKSGLVYQQALDTASVTSVKRMLPLAAQLPYNSARLFTLRERFMLTTFPAPEVSGAERPDSVANDTPLYTDQLPVDLYLAEQVRQLDACAINEYGIAGIHLMKRAGRAAFEALLAHWPQAEQLVVFCGGGNNAGDGYVVAALAAQQRIPVTLFYLVDPEQLQGDPHTAYQYARREGVIMQPFAECGHLADGSVVVDAMLGIGARGTLREPYAQAARLINGAQVPVIALDVPSGLCADTGATELAVQADITVTFIGVKRGLLTGRGPALTGQLYFADLDVPAEIYRGIDPSLQRLQLPLLLSELPERDGDAHKGNFGHVLVIGGDLGMAGAAAMAGEAAARIGAGLTSVVTRPEHVAGIIARRPELMVTGVPSGQQLEPLLERPSVLVLGPGLGLGPWSEQMLQKADASDLPMVLDADGLNLLAEGRVLSKVLSDDWVLTPHPGEAARLLHCSVDEIQADRFAAAQALQQRYGGCALLKGAGTVIAGSDGSLALADVGNPGMASGGMGDVLSGVIGGLMAQGLSATTATQLAACLHGHAADLAVADEGQRGLLATDLLPYLRHLLNDQDD